jgi:MFS family permease
MKRMDSDTTNLIIAIGLVLMLAGVVAGIFFMLSMQRALQLCAPQNRTLAPGKVWLCFIPLFGLVWIFVVVNRMADSLRLEFESRQAPPEDYGRTIGLTYCILAVISIIPLIGALTGLAAPVCWIIYWVKISAYARRLEQTGSYSFPEGGPIQKYAEAPFDPGQAWLLLLILMFAYASQHLQNLGISWFAPVLREEFRLTSAEIGWIFTAYGFGLVLGFILMTVVTALCGSRWGLVVALAGVSLAAAGFGLASSVLGMTAARALLGFFSGGLLPAAIQSLRERFPAPLRPLAIGLFLASSPLVALLVSPLRTHLTGAVGWRTAFMFAGAPTVIAAALCWVAVRPPAPSGGSRGVSTLAVVSVVMLGVGFLLTTPLFAYTQSMLPLMLMRGSGSNLMTMLSTINTVATAGGALLAGGAAWAMIQAGVSPWKTRAALLTLFGLILTVAGFLGIKAADGMFVVVSALLMGAFQGWSTLLFAAVADTLPERGVGIGVAIGALIMSSLMMLAIPGLSMLTMQFGFGVAVGVSAALAAAGLLCISLLAWLIHPKPPIFSTHVPVAG